MPDIEHIRIPDEISFALARLCERFPEVASFGKGGVVTLNDLTLDEQIAVRFIKIPCFVDEIIDNINLVMSDLEMLAKSARSFSDNYPLRRYKLLVRTFFYEFGRFEEAFAYFTLSLHHQKYISKVQRRSLMDDFYTQIKPMVQLRNVCLHDMPDWSKSITKELVILESLDLFKLQTKDKAGNPLEWDTHLGPLCLKMAESFHEATSEMRTFWNMLLVNLLVKIIEEKKIKPARKRFRPKNIVNTPRTRN
jgi:hypothetical protein